MQQTKVISSGIKASRSLSGQLRDQSPLDSKAVNFYLDQTINCVRSLTYASKQDMQKLIKIF